MTMTFRSQSRTLPTMATSPRRQAGFSLVELMIVVAIIGILSALAYTSYQDSMIKSRRKAATACMLEASQAMERYYTTNLTYLGGAVPALTCRADLALFYGIDLTAAATARAYSIGAVPVAGSIQAAKDKCGTLTIDQIGAKTRSGTLPVAECFP